ncbi:hypothetical protein ES288_A07G045600v1 [Gossypium darwinii]|uniref:Uncharacterized protein n=2 Tax=Gossypium TaxID=3633 RepID=A0A5D2PN96_GOSTO|nr:hypothetical protein ES288_A07G045600v1 [Gossypium darwinii]TYI17707.1 hypothetical protein ES332_A07G044800v1 [Gossypium tomentosum]
MFKFLLFSFSFHFPIHRLSSNSKSLTLSSLTADPPPPSRPPPIHLRSSTHFQNQAFRVCFFPNRQVEASIQGSLVQALGTRFTQFVQPVFQRCINIIQTQQLAKDFNFYDYG